MHESRLANLLGACGLAVTDLTLRTVTARLSASCAAAVVVLPAVRRPLTAWVPAAACGALAALALATRHQLLTVAVVLSSLYPAVPVLLGITLLHERVTRWQVCELVCAGTAIGLLALG